MNVEVTRFLHLLNKVLRDHVEFGHLRLDLLLDVLLPPRGHLARRTHLSVQGVDQLVGVVDEPPVALLLAY
jgi:hypothetical protein